MEYNAAFFGLQEVYFLVLKEEKGEQFALEMLKKVMERTLGKAYTFAGFRKGDPHSFARVVEGRDEAVGLHVEFPEVTERAIVYQFHTDPFPNLKGHVDSEKLDAAYMKFKVEFLLGKDWSYRTTKHLWNGDAYTEHVIEKK
ncbi:MAG: hypothetical protein J4400_04645 [Candidatus Aenigmarchaeota archaeon]|nr:hypothetical protein [Candidatus Aenigmarchaeota archaeon]